MASAGILEDMFSGYGIEYLYFKQIQITPLVLKFLMCMRDYDWGFGLRL